MPERNRSEQEMRNGVDVNQWLDHLASHTDIPIDLNLLCYINKLILRNTDRDYWAGRVRSEVDWQDPAEWSRQRAIVALDNPGLAVSDPVTGNLVTQFPPDSQVGRLLSDLIAWLNTPEFNALSPIERAAVFHHEFTRIHPFRDGNGRTARAIMTLLLRRANFGYELFVLQQVLDENRTTYIQALRQADDGDLTDWILFLAKAIKQAIVRTIALKKLTQRG